ncbi:MAG: CAP domain-containing protein [Rubellimicrobium sp.]|nr:CAP domain-containing protein [Rubellimicrobium sp.]
MFRILPALCVATLLSGCLIIVPVPGPTITTGAPAVTRTSTEPATARVPVVPLDPAGVAFNRLRAAHGQPPLVASANLMRAAQSHAEDMARTGTVAHQVAGGGDLASRLRRFGCVNRSGAENIAAGQTSATAAAADWAANPAHRSNILGPYTTYGSGQSGGYYVTILSSDC